MELRERIIKETFRLLISNSYKALTMDEIAQNLGISKRTLYEQFSDKNDLLINCLNAFFKAHIKHCDEVCASETNPMLKLLKFIEATIDMMTKVGQDKIIELQKYNSTIYSQIFIPFFEYKRRTSIKFLKQAQKEGYILDILDFDFFINMVKENMFLTTLYEYLKINTPYNAIQIATIHIYIIIRGICTSKGLELMDTYTKDTLALITKSQKTKSQKKI